MKQALAALLLAGCVTTPPPKPVKREPTTVVVPEPPEDRQAALRAVVQQFVTATEARRFEEVLPLLTKSLRARYSVESLARDFGADPLAAARLEEIKKKVSGSFVEAKDSAALEWAAGRSLRLAWEPEGWRISAIE